MTALTHRAVAHNDAQTSDNRMHSDEMARKYGFHGALVPGVTVYGHLVHPLTARYGDRWLGAGQFELRLIKPAYHGDELRIAGTADGGQVKLACENGDGTMLATLEGNLGEQRPEGPWRTPPAGARHDRVEIAWDAIDVDSPLPAMHFRPERADNEGCCELLRDELPLWSNAERAPAHPLYLARITNSAFSRHWFMPAWIHVGTRFRHLRVIRLGDELEVRTIPVEKWTRRGHQFARLYIAMLVDGRPALEAQHTAIFRVAER